MKTLKFLVSCGALLVSQIALADCRTVVRVDPSTGNTITGTICDGGAGTPSYDPQKGPTSNCHTEIIISGGKGTPSLVCD